MRDGKRGAPLHQGIQRFLHDAFGFVVQRAGGFIQNQNRRIFQKYARDGNALLLSAGKLKSVFAHVGIIAVFQIHDEFVRARQLCGADDFISARAGLAVFDVAQHCAGEHVYVLLHHADVAAQRFQREIADIAPVDADRTAGYIIKAGNQAAQRGLAAAGGAYDGDAFAGLCAQADIVQHAVRTGFIGEGNVVKFDFAAHVRKLRGVFLFLNRGRNRHDFFKAFKARNAALELF